MPRAYVSCLVVVLLVSLPSFSQAHNHAAPLVIKGSEHPEQISDQRVWLMEFIAASHGKATGYDESTITGFRTQFNQLTTTYNSGLSDGKHGTTAADIALRQQFFEDVEQLLKITTGKVQNSMSPSDWKRSIQHIQANKTRMTVTDDSPTAQSVASISDGIYHPGEAALLRAQWTYLMGYVAAGYTTYTVLDSDGSNWHQVVLLFGASTGTWTCQWNSYSSSWEPPGCPAHHDFYTSNNINYQGWSNYYEATAWNPAQYEQIWHENVQPIGANNGSEWASADASVICSVAGTLIGPSVDWIFDYIRAGTTYEQWNNSLGNVGGKTTCGMTPVCRNSPPYIVDLYYVFAGTANYSGCAKAYKCTGVCIRTPVSAWSCTETDPTKAFCSLLLNGAPTNPKQLCDAHP